MRFIYDAPAILHKGALIVGDTHFGCERRLRREGIHDESFSERIFLHLKALIKRHKARKIIFIGDVKEDVTMLDGRTADILSRLSLQCEITIVKGNHDGGIERCGCAKIVESGGFVHEGLALIHGHSWPDEELMGAKFIVSGHQHPMVAIGDSAGRIHKEPAWLIADCDSEETAKRYPRFNRKIKLVLMPAFNPIMGSAIDFRKKNQLGPLLNNNLFKLSSALVIRLDGTCLGNLKNLK